jgi:hypothetical protein
VFITLDSLWSTTSGKDRATAAHKVAAPIERPLTTEAAQGELTQYKRTHALGSDKAQKRQKKGVESPLG